MSIIVENPKYQGEQSDYSRRYPEDLDWLLFEPIQAHNINPQDYPNLIDIFSGDQFIAESMGKLGWKQKNTLCVDIAKQPNKSKFKLKHWDLVKLNADLKINRPVPNEISDIARSFDVMTSFYPYIDDGYIFGYMMPVSELLSLSNYFLRKGGVLIHNSTNFKHDDVYPGWARLSYSVFKKL